MPPLKRIKWEMFAQEVSKGSTNTEAYIKAGYNQKYARENAPKLLQNTAITDRIAELQGELAAKYLLCKEDMLLILGKIARDEDASNRDKVSAIHQASKMQGFESDKVDLSVTNKEAEELSDEDLEDIIKASGTRIIETQECSL